MALQISSFCAKILILPRQTLAALARDLTAYQTTYRACFNNEKNAAADGGGLRRHPMFDLIGSPKTP